MAPREIVLGPPGTGKTTTLLNRVEEELSNGTDPKRIGYISFTKKAANEAISRACKKFDRIEEDFPWFRTVHSLCFRALGCRSEEVLQGKKLTVDFAHYARTKIDSRWLEDGTLAGFTPGAQALRLENLARIKMVDLLKLYDTFPEEPGVSRNELIRIAKCLHAFKKAHGYIDFTDMLEQFVRDKLTISLDVLFIDEAQDLSKLQWQVVTLLGNNPSCRRVVIAGDDDQAIYQWSGADVEGFLNLQGKVEVLGQSHRVPRAIQSVADILISKVKKRFEKTWLPRPEEGEVERAMELPELVGDDILILARNNFTLIELQDELKMRGVIYQLGEHSSVSVETSRAILGWEQLRRGEKITAQQARDVYKKLGSRIGVAYGFKTLKDFAEDDMVTMKILRERGGLLAPDEPWYIALDVLAANEVAYIRRALQKGESLTKKPRVRLSTIHGAKGGEADHVMLMLEQARRSYEHSKLFPDEELRVWYVGVTRAMRKLTLIEARSDMMRCRWL